eukprot:MONOS_10274.1-p1 / transcript=MONOS_10274.1 / gene=MONOS_10274 / organism=Monocercomonoides_exilis_PA203 / gene_product=unspecified product / transcript_product=unspecified product / location=Mono_scaffold00459:47902-48372(+) / protein_length=157 / sequence_SO=supercontig / SO=protein_coding / is_pseudo=false
MDKRHKRVSANGIPLSSTARASPLSSKTQTSLAHSWAHFFAAASSIRVDRYGFANNSPSMPSLWPGDAFLPVSSLWLLNRRCTLHGIPSHNSSLLFISELDCVQANHTPDTMALTFSGLLLAPCNLSLAVGKRNSEEKKVDRNKSNANGSLSEGES